MILGFDHVQLTIPPGGEPTARRYYGELLGMVEEPKPDALRGRGGCWFRSGAVQLHLGVHRTSGSFVPAAQAHPAFVVDDLIAVAARIRAAGHTCIESRDEIPGVVRFHTFDPFGNRLEFQQT